MNIYFFSGDLIYLIIYQNNIIDYYKDYSFSIYVEFKSYYVIRYTSISSFISANSNDVNRSSGMQILRSRHYLYVKLGGIKF